MRTMEEIEYLNAENDALKKRIKELELALENSREHEKALRKCFDGHRKQIKELEADKLRQENYCESLVNENKRLNEIIISKDMVGAELHNENKELKRAKRAHLIELGDAEEYIKELEAENKALRFNLEDWKHKAEEMELTAKSFDAEIALSHERIQKLTTEKSSSVKEG